MVANKTLSNATVCLDLDQNMQCDTGEPASSPTGVDGRYTIHYQPADTAAATAAAAAGVVATLTPQTVDAANPNETHTSKTLSYAAPAGKPGQINPLTTLVQFYVKSGKTLAEAEAAVAHQLVTDVASLYDYQGEALNPRNGLPGEVRTSANVTAFMLEMGVTPTLTRNEAFGNGQLGYFYYADGDNYHYRYRTTDNVVQADGFLHQFENRSAKSGGNVVGHNDLFPSVSLTSKGWTRCDNTVPRLYTEGVPSRTFTCNDSSRYVGGVKEYKDVSGSRIADVIASIQSGDQSLYDAGLRYDLGMFVSDPSVLGDARFPAGSYTRVSVSVQNDNSPIYINNAATDRFGFNTLEQLIASRPASNVNLATAAGTTGGMGLLDEGHTLRVAFVDDKTAQYYSCKATAPAYTDPSDCTTLSQTGYTVDTQNGVKVLTFANFPAITGQAGVSRGYAEYDGKVAYYRRPAPITKMDDAVTYSIRLNEVAWNAIKSTLKID